MNEKVFNKKKIITFILVIGLVIVLLFIPHNVKVKVEEELTISASTYSSKIKYGDIQEMKILDEFEKGTRVFGMGTIFNDIGDYTNSSGKYRLYTYTKVNKYIYLSTNEDKIVFNLSSEKLTEEMYQEILKKIN